MEYLVNENQTIIFIEQVSHDQNKIAEQAIGLVIAIEITKMIHVAIYQSERIIGLDWWF